MSRVWVDDNDRVAMNVALDSLHDESTRLIEAIRRHVAGLRHGISVWAPAPCPPRGQTATAIWLDEATPVPLQTPMMELPEHAKVWDADDPLLRRKPWFR